MVFRPPRSPGLAIGLGALAALGLVDLALVFVLRRGLLSPAGFLAFSLIGVSLPLAALLAYRVVALARARYVVSRNALVVEWGARRLVVPAAMLLEARPAAEVPARLRPRGLAWPGSVLGWADVDALGEVEFLAATSDPAGLVLVRHPEAWLALSPEAPSAFLAALSAAQAEGSDEAVVPESAWPAFEHWPLLHDRLALGLILTGGLSVLLLLGYLALISPQVPDQIALHFNPQGAPDRFGPPAGLLILPAIAALAWLANTFLSLWLHASERERPASYLPLAATLLIQVLVWVATLGLLNAGPG